MHLSKNQISLLLAVLLFISLNASGQKTLVFGRIVEATTGAPIAFASIAFKGAAGGTYSDQLGNYSIETPAAVTQLAFTAVGYYDTIINIRQGQLQEIRMALISKEYQLNEVVIKAGENPAYEILRKVIERKKINDTGYLDSYQYRSYNKVQFDLNNFSDKIKKNPLFRPFPFIWEYQDSMSNGVRYLPFVFKENVREHYYRKSPQTYREYITGTRKAQFFRGPKIEKFIEELYLNPDVYENFLVILTKSFPSPVNDDYKRFYKFVLDDSLKYLDGLPCHHIRFYPKGASDVAFTGEMFIHDSTFAVKRMDLNFSITANINFVRSFWIRLDYEWLQKKHWFIKEATVLADFTVIENSPELTGFFGRRFSEYKNVVINQAAHDSIFSPVDQVTEIESATSRDDNFFESERGDSLTSEEKNIFLLVDTIQQNWKFKVFKKAFTTIGTGWIPQKNFDIGNIFTFISYNDVEALRLKAGFRTSKNSNFNWQPRAYIAYGTGDSRFKFLTELNRIFRGAPGKYNLIGASWQEDADQPGRSYYAIPLDNFLTYFLQTAPFDTRTFVQNREVYLERQWFFGFVTRISAFRQDVVPFGNYKFYSKSFDNQLTPVNEFVLSGLRFSGRFAYGEKEIHARFNDPEARFFMLKYPSVSFDYMISRKGWSGSEFDYSKIAVRIEHQQRLNRWGYTAYLAEAGTILGTVPYPFLGIPFGNQAILADRASFNMMNYLEFASDKYIALHVEHHFEGLFFNRIPGVRKLKLREFLLARMFAGDLSDKNNQKFWAFPERMHAINEPYLEVGFGIENILKLGRIDFTWRLNYLDHNNTYSFLPKPSFQFRF